MTKVFVTGGSGLVGGALVKRLVERGDEVTALARSDEAAAKLEAAGARTVRGDVFDEPALKAGMTGNELVYHVAGINTFCPTDPAALFHVNVRGAEIAVRAAHAAEVPRVVLTSSAAALGEAEGTVGNEDSPHRGSYMSVYERSKHEGEVAAFAAARSGRPRPRGGQPVERPGPGPCGRDRPDHDRLPQRQAEGVREHPAEHRRHRRHRRGAYPGRRARPARRALRDQQRHAARRRRRWRSSTGSPASSTPSASSRRSPPAPLAAGVEAGFRARGKKPPMCREMMRTMLHGHRYDGSRATTRARPAVHADRGHLPAHHRLGPRRRSAEGLDAPRAGRRARPRRAARRPSAPARSSSGLRSSWPTHGVPAGGRRPRT